MNLLERIQPLLKTVLLVALGVFLYTRIANGTLYYYINERFAIFTVIGIVGLLLLGLSYRWESTDGDQKQMDDHHHQEGGHSHALTWGGVLILTLPVLLGLSTTPQPLGAAALANRDVTLSMQESALPLGLRGRGKAAIDKNIMDWWHDFRSSAVAGRDLVGQPVQVSGFVFRDERFGNDHFLITRFVVSCCVADANVLGLLVQISEPLASTMARIDDDQWVEIQGNFIEQPLDGWQMPVVAATAIDLIDVPEQPYLYP